MRVRERRGGSEKRESSWSSCEGGSDVGSERGKESVEGMLEQREGRREEGDHGRDSVSRRSEEGGTGESSVTARLGRKGISRAGEQESK